MEVPLWFMVVFILYGWLFGSGGQILAVLNQRLHQKIGFTEERAFEPDFKWYKIDEYAIACSDVLHFVTGFLFIVFYFSGQQNLAIKCGCFTFAIYIYISFLCVFRILFLSKNNLYPTSNIKQTRNVLIIVITFGLYSIFGAWYLCRLL